MPNFWTDPSVALNAVKGLGKDITGIGQSPGWDIFGIDKKPAAPASTAPATASTPGGYTSGALPTYGSPLDQIAAYSSAFSNAGDPQQVYNYLAKTDPSVLKQGNEAALQTELGKFATYSGWTPAGEGGTAASGTGSIDPTSVQMFMQQAIVPYLNQLQGNEKATAQSIRGQDVSGLPAPYQAVMKANNAQQGNDMDMLMQATQAQAAGQPQVDLLMAQLAATQKAQQTAAARYLATGAAAPPALP